MTIPTLKVLKTMTRSELLAIRTEVERRLRILRYRERAKLRKAARRNEIERRRAIARATLELAASIAGVSGPRASRLAHPAPTGHALQLSGDLDASIRVHETACLRSDARRATALAEQAGLCLTELLQTGSGRS